MGPLLLYFESTSLKSPFWVHFKLARMREKEKSRWTPLLLWTTLTAKCGTKQCDFHGKNDGGALYFIFNTNVEHSRDKDLQRKRENYGKMSRILWTVLPRSWTGCGIVDCPEFVMIDTINGAVQSEINSQWLKMTKCLIFRSKKLLKEAFTGCPNKFWST